MSLVDRAIVQEWLRLESPHRRRIVSVRRRRSTHHRDRKRLLLALHEFVTGERLPARVAHWRMVLGQWVPPDRKW